MILVTGATGFIGSHLVRRCVGSGRDVVGLIHDVPVWSKWLRECLGGVRLIQGDVTNCRLLKRVINQYSVDTVIHLAAQSIVKRAWRDPVNTFYTNVMGTVKVLEACRQLDGEKVLVQSTDKVYGEQMLAHKASPLKPTEPYGTSKLCADAIAQCYIETYGMDILIPRCCNVYGYDLNNRIVPNTIRSCMRGDPPVIYRNDTSERQYIFVGDVTDTFMQLLEAKKRGPVNLATDDILTQEEVVRRILKHFPGMEPRYVDKPPLKEIHRQCMAADYPKKHTPFDEGIRLTIHDFKRYGG